MKISALLAAAGDVNPAAELFSTVLIALIVGFALVAFIRHLRMTPEERAEAARLKKEKHEAEAARWKYQQEREAENEAQHAALPPAEPTPPLIIAGLLLLLAGVGVFFIGAFIVNVSVEGVNNIGLMLDRLITVLTGLALGFTGALCLVAEKVRSALSPAKITRPEVGEAAGEAIAQR